MANITQSHLDDAVAQGILSTVQAEQLWQFLLRQTDAEPSFSFTHLLYYLGGLLAIGAMSLFMTLGWEAFGGWGMLVISLIYMLAGVGLLQRFSLRGFAIPAGICGAFVVAVAPLAIYGLQQGLGFWPDDTVYREYHRYIKWHWLYLELGTLVVGLILLWRYRYPFMVMPVAVTLWYLSMDLAVMLHADTVTWEFRAFISLWVGLLMILLAVWLDIRRQGAADFAFWIYLFGVLAFWGGLTSQESHSELSKLIYCSINLVMMGGGIVLARRVFVVFGAIGCCLYVGHLANEVFQDSWLFPIALTLLGLAVIYAGILWQKHERVITQALRQRLPVKLQRLLNARKY